MLILKCKLDSLNFEPEPHQDRLWHGMRKFIERHRPECPPSKQRFAQQAHMFRRRRCRGRWGRHDWVDRRGRWRAPRSRVAGCASTGLDSAQRLPWRRLGRSRHLKSSHRSLSSLGERHLVNFSPLSWVLSAVNSKPSSKH